MQKIVINKRHGGFGLSDLALAEYQQTKFGVVNVNFHEYGIERDDPVLVEIVERLGDLAENRYSALKVVEIPDDVDWTIGEYDGFEWVQEVHRTWD